MHGKSSTTNIGYHEDDIQNWSTCLNPTIGENA